MHQIAEAAAANLGRRIVELAEELPIRLQDRQGRVETYDTHPWLVELAQEIGVLGLFTSELVGGWPSRIC
ncbi:hypothetical protein ABVG11_35220 [Streptomyces sp. HD1123-B1]|uniref:hypothetical protein n=1 Tax=Streptomyces TaxID=1883 RepID=UPI003D7EF52E